MTTVAELVSHAAAQVRGLTPAEVEAHALEGRAVLVDLREPEELDEHGLIAGAVHAPRGMLEFLADPASALHRAELDPARTTILYCAAGSRSALAGVALQALGYADVAHLEGGLKAWTAAGLPVVGLRRWHLHSHEAGETRQEGTHR